MNLRLDINIGIIVKCRVGFNSLEKNLSRATATAITAAAAGAATTAAAAVAGPAMNLPILPHHAAGWEISAGLAQALEIKTMRDHRGFFFQKKSSEWFSLPAVMNKIRPGFGIFMVDKFYYFFPLCLFSSTTNRVTRVSLSVSYILASLEPPDTCGMSLNGT